MLQKVVLNIDSPSHDGIYEASGAVETVNVDFNGSTVSTDHGGITLFHKWYSSLAAELGTGLSLSWGLRVGTHVVTFSAADQDDAGVAPDDLEPLYASMAHMGYAGGAPVDVPDPDNPGPMVIHVFIANMLSPEPGATTLSRSNPDLKAEVPMQWAAFPDYLTPDPAYHASNRISYRWRLENLTTGDSDDDVLVNEADMIFHPSDDVNPVAWLGYDAPLADLTIGHTYRIILRVEHSEDDTVGHEVFRDLEIVS